MDVFCGIDWAEGHHDVAIIDNTGKLLAECRIDDDLDGYQLLLDLLADHGDSAETPIPVAIETSRGLLVATLRTGARQVFAINPMAASRYRDRHGVSRKKSDPGDALVLANIVRTDMPMHRPLPADSDLAQAIAVLARAHQDAVWNRQQIANQLRSLLREYYRAALETWRHKAGGLTRPDARKILAAAPTPTEAAEVALWKLKVTMHNAGRQRWDQRGHRTDSDAVPAAGRPPATGGGGGHGHPGQGSAGPAERRLHGSRRACQGGRTDLPNPPRRPGHAQLPRYRPWSRCPPPGRDRRRPHPLRHRWWTQGIRGSCPESPGPRANANTSGAGS